MALLLQLDAVAAHLDDPLPARAALVVGRARLVGAAVVLVRHLVAVPIGPGASEVLLRPGQLGTAVDVVRYAVAVAIGEERAATAFGGAWNVGAEIVDVGHPVPVAVLRGHGRRDDDRRRRFRPCPYPPPPPAATPPPPAPALRRAGARAPRGD